MIRGWGHNKQLTRAEVTRDVLEGLQRRAQTAGQVVPDDIVEFLQRADVYFFDAHGNPVTFETVVVTWEDR